jgi:hypothetical protein
MSAVDVPSRVGRREWIGLAAPPEHAGTAAVISETGSELGGAFGIAVLGSTVVVVILRG